MSYTPTTWTTGDTITASALNKIENGIAGSSAWDAVIRLTHADNSGPDGVANLTPSIVSGSYSDLYAKCLDDKCPCILVEYYHPWGSRYSAPMAYIVYFNSESITIVINGFSYIDYDYISFGELFWANDDSLEWAE